MSGESKAIRQIGLVLETMDGEKIFIHADESQAAGSQVTVDHENEFDDFGYGPMHRPLTTCSRFTITIENLNGYTMHIPSIQKMLDAATVPAIGEGPA